MWDVERMGACRAAVEASLTQHGGAIRLEDYGTISGGRTPFLATLEHLEGDAPRLVLSRVVEGASGELVAYNVKLWPLAVQRLRAVADRAVRAAEREMQETYGGSGHEDQ